MANSSLKISYIGGPTALLEMGGVRILTDPTFDPAGGAYSYGPVTLHKTMGPAVTPENLGHIHVVLLSHEHHPDNLDLAGRDVARTAEFVLTTAEGAERLHDGAVALRPWESIDLPAPNGRVLQVTATPARHGPPERDRGPVIGFVLRLTDTPDDAVYVSGDTVWFEGVAEVAARFPVKTALLFMGAARVPEVGPYHLTLTADEAVGAARTFQNARIVPLHFEGWKHFSESRADIQRAFDHAGLSDRLWWV